MDNMVSFISAKASVNSRTAHPDVVGLKLGKSGLELQRPEHVHRQTESHLANKRTGMPFAEGIAAQLRATKRMRLVASRVGTSLP